MKTVLTTAHYVDTLVDTARACAQKLHCWPSFTSTCKCVDLKFSLCVLCLTTLMLYLCWGLFSLQRKNLCLNGSALKVAPTTLNGLQTRLGPRLLSVPILCIHMERSQPVWRGFLFWHWVDAVTAHVAFWNWEVTSVVEILSNKTSCALCVCNLTLKSRNHKKYLSCYWKWNMTQKKMCNSSVVQYLAHFKYIVISI